MSLFVIPSTNTYGGDPEREKHRALGEKLFAEVSEIKELENGVALRFSGDDATLRELPEFIKNERRCCPFFTFVVRVEGRSAIWMELTGTPAVKEFLMERLEAGELT